MTLQKATQRIQWRFTSGNSFQPNENDIESINFIFNWINTEKSERIKANGLFIKLYIYFFHKSILSYGGGNFDMLPQQELNKLLDTPIRSFYESFHKTINNNANDKIIKDGVKPTDKEMETIINGAYSFDEVVENLNEMITESINKYQTNY